jgi:hypothetical protein
MAARLSALCAGRFLPPGKFLVLISVRGWVDPSARVSLEGLRKLKKSTSSGTQTGDLPACSIVPQPTMLLRAPACVVVHEHSKARCNNWNCISYQIPGFLQWLNLNYLQCLFLTSCRCTLLESQNAMLLTDFLWCASAFSISLRW